MIFTDTLLKSGARIGLLVVTVHQVIIVTAINWNQAEFAVYTVTPHSESWDGKSSIEPGIP